MEWNRTQFSNEWWWKESQVKSIFLFCAGVCVWEMLKWKEPVINHAFTFLTCNEWCFCFVCARNMRAHPKCIGIKGTKTHVHSYSLAHIHCGHTAHTAMYKKKKEKSVFRYILNLGSQRSMVQCNRMSHTPLTAWNMFCDWLSQYTNSHTHTLVLELWTTTQQTRTVDRSNSKQKQHTSHKKFFVLCVLATSSLFTSPSSCAYTHTSNGSRLIC